MKIYWALERISTLIDEVDFIDTMLVLGDQEGEVLGRLKVPKRRQEWLAGRLLTKRLIRLADSQCKNLNFNEIQVLNAASGAPYVVIRGNQKTSRSISISHSNGYALSAYSVDGVHFGFDLEKIEPRSKVFVQDFFTSRELAQIETITPSEQPLYTTVIWSAKESVLKALSTGLRVDTRNIEIGLTEIPILRRGWKSLEMESGLVKINSLRLVWRREGEFVITACVPPNFVDGLEQIDPYNNLDCGR